MLTFLAYLIFIVSVALAAGGIILASRLRKTYGPDFFSILLYFQIFIYTFGFYGIWGQFLIRSFLYPYITVELLGKITDLFVLMGMPFLVFAWMMLVRFSISITGRMRRKWFVLWFLILNFTMVCALGYLITVENEMRPVTLFIYYYILMNGLYVVISAGLIWSPVKGKTIIFRNDSKIIAPVLIIIMLIQSVLLLLYNAQTWLALIFILTFFTGNTFLPLYFNYGTILKLSDDQPVKDISFENFCIKFEISPRETDIIREICNGLSNKEISDKLFISLQTVKDHTHRIYGKTNVKSRVQLIYLIQGLKG
jgi:DNA-binding CsgD family transcriptional regulator